MTFDNKKKANSVFWWTLKKYLPFSIAYWVLLFLTMPMIEIITFSVCSVDKNAKYIDTIKEIMPYVPTTAFTFVVIAFSTIIGIMGFAYLHNKRSMDFFGSLPVSRRTMFFSRFAASFISSVVPMIAFLVIGIALSGSTSAIISILKTMGLLTVAVLGNISIIAVISICCGTVADVIISYLLLNVIYPIVILVCYYFPMLVIPGTSKGFINGNIFTFLSPVASAYTGYFCGKTALYVIWWLILSLSCIVGCVFLTKKRKTETAQNAFSFVLPEVVIKFFTSFAGGFGLGVIFSFIGFAQKSKPAQYIWFWIGFIFGSFICHILLHLIFNRGLKKFGKSLIQYGAVSFMSVIFFFAVVTGGFGYVNHVPSADNVKSVKMTAGVENSFIVNGEDVFANSSENKEDIALALDVHNKAIKNINEKHGMLLPIISNNVTDTESVTIKYQMKNGSILKRFYDGAEVQDKEIEKAVNIFEKNNKNDAFYKIPEKYINYIDIYSYENKDGEENENNIYSLETYERKSDCLALLRALTKDSKKYGIIENPNEKGEEAIFSFDLYYDGGEIINRGNFLETTDGSYNAHIYIDSRYKNTIKELKGLKLTNSVLNGYTINAWYYYDDEGAYDLDKENTVYFKMPKDWDKSKPVYCVSYCDDEDIYSFAGKLSEDIYKCKSLGKGIYSYIIPTYDRDYSEFYVTHIMFYQITDDSMNVSGLIPLDDGKIDSSKNMFVPGKMLSKKILCDDIIVAGLQKYEYSWQKYKN
ncbi:MAG: hypothetical protein ACI4QE_00980 [Acutalibacteraceae bacterium]